ncbi:MAG: Clp1/GlmU family protein [Thioalkalispiraceae bacterium]
MKTPAHGFIELAADAAGIVAKILAQDRRVLLFGPPGVGKSTLVTQLAHQLAQQDRGCWCFSADPGTPLLGIPGTVSVGCWQQDAWQVDDAMALCSLDAGRFRLPLLSALQQLLAGHRDGVMLFDGPGVVRGVAGRELLQGLVATCGIDTLLVLSAKDKTPPLLDELQALGLPVYVVVASHDARRPGKRVRARARTAQWDAYLAQGEVQQFDLAALNVIGTPPPRELTPTWTGRQVALLKAQRTLAMGEVVQLKDGHLTVKVPANILDADSLLIRDAQRSLDGLLETAVPWVTERLDYLPTPDVLPEGQNHQGPRLVGRVGHLDLALINGVFGDPLLHLRLRHQRRSLLFDLGSGERLSARIAHQVTDVFISHAHLDHISGFVWLMRSRIGEYPACRLYGPPGLAQHVSGFIRGVLWDRVELNAPRFEVMEYDGQYLRCYRLQATQPEPHLFEERVVDDGLLLEDKGFCVRAIRLDHQGTPVLAFAFEPEQQLNVRKDRLAAQGLAPGPWLNELKQHCLSGNLSHQVELPNGHRVSVATLADDLLLITPGKRLVYATDLADTVDNRQRLIRLAQNAHTFFCEAPFVEAEAEHAFNNGHLTTQACGEIAMAAQVARLVPFHLSRRHVTEPQQLYEEIKLVCPQVVEPVSMRLFETASRRPQQEKLTLD